MHLTRAMRYMGNNSNRKGAEGERELADLLCKWGWDAERQGHNQRYGKQDVPDVAIHDLPQLHVECKRKEHLSLPAAIAQAVKDAKPDQCPAVIHRKNREDWYITMRAEDFFRFVKDFCAKT